jgi:hypothetical protein
VSRRGAAPAALPTTGGGMLLVLVGIAMVTASLYVAALLMGDL